MAEETSYFWLNCGYNRWNHNEPLVGQTTLFESGAQFNPSQGFRSFKQAKVGDKVIFYQVQMDTGLLGFGEITSVQSGAQNKIRVHFELLEQLKPLTTDYLKRSEQLEFRISNMKEKLFNQITQNEFELIVSLGKGETKIPRYFFMSEEHEFEPNSYNTIYTHTYNGIKRNGYHFYTQLEIGDLLVFYNKHRDQSVIGIGEVSQHIHEKSPIPGRTNSTAIEVYFEKEIEPVTLSTLNKHPKLKNLYYLQENAKQAIASMSRAQFEAILEMSENDGMKSQFEAVKSDYIIDKSEDDIKPFILLVVDKGEGLKAAENLLQKTNANPVITAGHPDFTEDMLYGKYLPNEAGALYYREGFITSLMPRNDKSYLVIDNFNRIDPDIFQTFINVLEGYEMTLPRYNRDGSMIKWSRKRDSFYHFNPNWHIVGITYDSLNEIKQKYTEQFLKYTRIVKVNQDS
ncbi:MULTISPECIES: EVE domain-containing protein [Staphylococcus]|jgi:predicted RNA-binding protein with PUA-like domain|uniref:EVE domain protein n=2 Tax=Staphylococcus nepalensis TaxID=214473 RepID=A0A291JJ35_9STAP|nr:MULTISPECIES: EVE domain-containing protein [Staphylococcus]VDG66522.1 EVE domain [Lacrimispora indolis]ATH59570.1 EVE domain-containing protein [Staphylococcus nepalensis]ATH64661.1 EVE domain-containing protein [Staphylococcus nepalensis]MBO1206951.1 EVE domain-containing protein [Staphylococcus nepalensis]MBO1212929.1 EVE domain-containing protein [Staphylococcus nepalensis]